MQKLDLYISKNAPNARNAAWLKPVDGGFALYVLLAGEWQPLKLTESKEAVKKEDIAQDLIGSVKDKKTANTINGAKAFVRDAMTGIIGTPKDASSDLTLNGLKAYIDEKVTAVLE